MRLTKIVCTIGPSCSDRETLREMIAAGLNLARLNFSHGDFDSHGAILTTIRELSEEMNTPVAILVDLCGPKIRVGALEAGPLAIEKGATVSIVPTGTTAEPNTLSCTYPEIVSDLKVGDRVLLDDGSIGLTVTALEPDRVTTRVDFGTEIKPNKGINLPGVAVSAPSVTDRDKEVIAWAIENEADWIALSFVRSADDLAQVKQLLATKGSPIRVIAKIERPEAVEQIESIVQATDAIMVARGDLGVEMPVEEVPLIQKRIISLCNQHDKPVITATQMLESMTDSPTPTRAEVSDVANAILDGTDAVMLSGETASGRHPVRALQTMATIAERTEAYPEEAVRRRERLGDALTVADAICTGARLIQEQLKVALIIAFTNSGSTALHMSKTRPRAPILAATVSDVTLRQICLYRGVIPVRIRTFYETEELFSRGIELARALGLVQPDDQVLIVAGVPLGQTGGTNMLRIQTVGEPA